MTLNYYMMVERYPNIKEEVDSSIPGGEISSLLERQTCQVVNCLLCFDIGMSTLCLYNNNNNNNNIGSGEVNCLVTNNLASRGTL
jgi:hypothetical protein